MSKTIPYVRDLRATAVTITAHHIAAGSHGAIEAALDAAAPFLVDAYLIEEAMAIADERAGADPHGHLQQLQQRGELPLRTLELEEETAVR